MLITIYFIWLIVNAHHGRCWQVHNTIKEDPNDQATFQIVNNTLRKHIYHEMEWWFLFMRVQSWKIIWPIFPQLEISNLNLLDVRINVAARSTIHSVAGADLVHLASWPGILFIPGCWNCETELRGWPSHLDDHLILTIEELFYS